MASASCIVIPYNSLSFYIIRLGMIQLLPKFLGWGESLHEFKEFEAVYGTF